MRSILVLTGFAVALSTHPAEVRADGDAKTVETEGKAAIINGDVAGAREKARKDALRLAVEQVAGVKTEAASVVKDYTLVSDTIRSTADGLVESYKVLEEKAVDNNTVYSVKVSASVTKSKAQDAFSLVLLESSRPKVAFIIAERMAGQTDFTTGNQERGKTENMLIDYFMERGLTVVDYGGMVGMNLSGVASSGELSAADADRLAEKADIQYVVVGKVVGVDAGPVMIQGIRSYNMSLTLKMFSTQTHEVVATSSKSNAIPCISPNLAPISCSKLYKDRVVDQVGSELLEKTSKAFLRMSVTGNKRVQVRANVATFALLQKFIKSLPDEVRGVNQVNQRSFKGGRAVLDIELEGGDVNYLASELSARKIGGTTIDVLGVNSEQLEIEIKK
jgi:hypothetical protein